MCFFGTGHLRRFTRGSRPNVDSPTTVGELVASRWPSWSDIRAFALLSATKRAFSA